MEKTEKSAKLILLQKEELTQLSGGYASTGGSKPTEQVPTLEEILNFKWY
ncbi:hypothetical protein [Bacteroides sp. 51]|nr:hypothetical protein [Bacteroides sp. 51]